MVKSMLLILSILASLAATPSPKDIRLHGVWHSTIVPGTSENPIFCTNIFYIAFHFPKRLYKIRVGDVEIVGRYHMRNNKEIGIIIGEPNNEDLRIWYTLHITGDALVLTKEGFQTLFFNKKALVELSQETFDAEF